MSGLLERVRATLADEYDVERELAGGGMGVVFLGRDRALDCPVAIKVLRMALATAVAAERFVQEGQMLARVRHPAIVTVHRAFSRDGLHFMIMELLQGTLADRLSTRQPIPTSEAIPFCEQLLDGLAQVHAAGIVHRDIKPSNIFIRADGGPKLGDFGIARRVDSGTEALTGVGQLIGTPHYMSPEQLVSSEVTNTSDIYAVGMVLHEMVTGRRWELEDPARGRWDGVPRRLVPVLRKALALEANRRWPDARAFGEALRNATSPALVPRVAVALAAVVVLGALAGIFRPRAEAPLVTVDRSEVALLTLSVEGGDPNLGRQIIQATEPYLNGGLGDSDLAVTPVRQSAEWAAEHPNVESLPASAWADLRTSAIMRGHARVFGDSVVVDGEVVERDGTIRPLSRRVSGPVNNLMVVGCKFAVTIVEAVEPQRGSAFTCSKAYTDEQAIDAINAYLDGRAAFAHDNWSFAETAFRRSIAIDSSSARAWWGLYNVCRWGRSCDDARDVREHLEQVYDRDPQHLGDLDHLLIEAEFAPTVPARLAIYDTAVRRFGYDAYPKLLLGNELFSRGPLFGVGLDSAISMLNAAATENPGLSPTYEMIVWAAVRLGDEQAARLALAHYQHSAYAEQTEGISFVNLLGQAINERFGPEAERQQGRRMLGASGLRSVATMLRLGLAFGVPDAQLMLGEAVAADPSGRFQGRTAQSLALLALGRIDSAFDAFDAAADAANDPDMTSEMTLQALEWAVELPALGLPGVPNERRVAARTRLARITGGVRGARASWALLLDALARDSVGAATEIARQLRETGVSPFLTRLSDALLTAATGDTSTALRVTDSLRVWVDSHHEIAAPLVRVALFLHRGRWLAPRDPAGADAAWRWYEAADWPGEWPSGPPKAGELDWAFETYARYLRAKLAHVHGNAALVCAVAPDAITRWQNADSAYESLRDSLVTWTASCGSS